MVCCTYISIMKKILLNTRFAILILVFNFGSAFAQTSIVPNYFDSQERIPIGDLSKIDRLRFLTTVDFPPFSFLDQNGRLTGFHVDLARAICSSLKILERCQIQGLEWDKLAETIKNKNGEAIIAGLAISETSRSQYLFSRSYLELPARFVARADNTTDLKNLNTDETQIIGVLKGTAHEAMLKSWFPTTKRQLFTSQEDLLKALDQKKINMLFGDGLQLSFWLQSVEAKNCCKFVGGPYLSQDFLGEGLAIAVAKDRPELIKAINYGLATLARDGKFSELYLRYFPNSIY